MEACLRKLALRCGRDSHCFGAHVDETALLTRGDCVRLDGAAAACLSQADRRDASYELAMTVKAAIKGTKPALRSVRLFISYSHLDEAHQKKLDTSLTPLRRKGLDTFFDGDIQAGEKLDPAIAKELRAADIFVALLSPDYIHSHCCWDIEYKRAKGRQGRGTLRVVDVVVRDCDWKETKAAQHKLLPKDGKAVSRWRSADTAWLDVIRGLKPVIASVRADLVRARPATKARKQGLKVPKRAAIKAKGVAARPAAMKRPRRRATKAS